MGKGWEQLFCEVSASRAEEEDELGESSPLSGDSDDEATSPANKSSSASHDDSHGTLNESSQVPVKRGLSKFYKGKSQSFSSFSDVSSVEDLAKKETPIMRKMKPSRSYARGLDDETGTHNSTSGDYNKGPRGSSCASSIARTTSGCSYFVIAKPPPIPMHKNM